MISMNINWCSNPRSAHCSKCSSYYGDLVLSDSDFPARWIERAHVHSFIHPATISLAGNSACNDREYSCAGEAQSTLFERIACRIGPIQTLFCFLHSCLKVLKALKIRFL